VDELDALLEAGAELVDVREKDERDTGYIAGSRNIPYRLLALGEGDLPRDKPIVTICESGPRAAIAASILAARGFDAHPVVSGGIDSWVEAGKPTVEFRRCGGG
jgi:rhodanese-related sulfurtransferase